MATTNPEVAKVAVSGTFNGEQVVNVFHWQKADGSDMTAANLASLHGLLNAAAANTYSLKYLYEPLDAGLLFDTLYSRTLSNTAPVELLSTVAIAGTNTGNDAPPMLAAMLKWTTSVADRRHRGRTYLPGLGTYMISTSDSDRLDASYLNTFQTRANAFAAAWDARTDFTFIIFSEKTRQANGSQSLNEVKAGSCDPVIRVQRRRRTGG